MEEEAAKLKQMQSEVDKQMTSPAGSASALNMSYEEKVCQWSFNEKSSYFLKMKECPQNVKKLRIAFA